MRTRRTRLSLWHASTRRFRTRVLRYLQARCDALDFLPYDDERKQATRSIRDAIERMT